MMLEDVDMDEDVTLAGETAQREFIDETMMAGAEEDSDLAWSAEEYAVDFDHGRPRHWPMWAALVLVLCLVTGAAVWLATVFYQQQWDHPVGVTDEAPTNSLSAPPPSEVGAPKPLPAPGPPAQHEQAPEPPPVAQPDPDQQFLAMVAAIPGITITNPQLEINETKVVCSELRDGATPGDIIAATLREAPTLSRSQAEQLFDAGTTIYCPKFSRR
jgi:cytoskeletal protein RodZ